jgi:hypothetical protein
VTQFGLWQCAYSCGTYAIHKVLLKYDQTLEVLLNYYFIVNVISSVVSCSKSVASILRKRPRELPFAGSGSEQGNAGIFSVKSVYWTTVARC